MLPANGSAGGSRAIERNQNIMRDLDCPSLSTLMTPELCEPDLAAHMASCATCRALGHLAAAAASPGSSRVGCDDVEMLLAAHVSGSELGPADAARLDRHLSQCGGCAATFAAIALDREGLAEIAGRPEREETRRVWSRAVEPAAARDALRRRRIAAALAGATALSAAVAAIVLLVPARTEERVLLFPARTEERPAAAGRRTAPPPALPTPVPSSTRSSTKRRNRRRTPRVTAARRARRCGRRPCMRRGRATTSARSRGARQRSICSPATSGQ
jgi:anti-sigma factor RsiW